MFHSTETPVCITTIEDLRAQKIRFYGKQGVQLSGLLSTALPSTSGWWRDEMMVVSGVLPAFVQDFVLFLKQEGIQECSLQSRRLIFFRPPQRSGDHLC